jgi:branched-chain amino acid transport system substrate-binding protein
MDWNTASLNRGAEGKRHNKTETEEIMTTRRKLIKQGALGAATLATTAMPWRMLRAQEKTVKAACIAPFSGPWARTGTLIRLGAEMAIDEINQKGGIKSLGGTKMELVSIDAGDSTEKAKNAAQRLVAQNPDVIGGTGAWLSSFTLAVTEVTERAEISWLTLSYADSITSRGFKYVFQTSATGTKQSIDALPTIIDLAKRATGKAPTTAGIIGDDTPAPLSVLKPMREGGLANAGIKVLMDETYTPPLSDATALMQKVRSTHPDFLLFISTNTSDLKLGLEKLNEFHLGKGVVPVIGNGAANGAPEVLKNMSAELLEGYIFTVANWGMKGQEPIIDAFKKRTGEPWMTQDSLDGYGSMWILKEALERTGVADKVKVGEMIHAMDIKDGPAAMAYPGPVKFDAAGHRVDAPLVIVQWQNGVPVTVYPADRAVATAKWPKSS